MMTTTGRKCVMLIAGEASGDRHGAKLVRAMRRGNDGLFFCGIGGPAMQAAGVRIVADAARLAVVGITEVLAKASFLLDGIRKAKNTINGLRPDLLILIDFPDFNLHVAASAKKMGIPVLYYICPQVWAWRPGRVEKIKKRVDHLAVILPFGTILGRSLVISSRLLRAIWCILRINSPLNLDARSNCIYTYAQAMRRSVIMRWKASRNP